MGSMGAAIMVPVALLMFATPLIVNLPPEQQALAALMKVGFGLFSIVIALFYQMALCASLVFEKESTEPKTSEIEEPA